MTHYEVLSIVPCEHYDAVFRSDGKYHSHPIHFIGVCRVYEQEFKDSEKTCLDNQVCGLMNMIHGSIEAVDWAENFESLVPRGRRDFYGEPIEPAESGTDS